MNLEILLSARAEQDITLQYRWYLDHADEAVAEHYLRCVHATFESISAKPDLGRRRRFAAQELAHVRSLQVQKPFDRHLIFYQTGASLFIERVLHGSRDLPRLFLNEP